MNQPSFETSLALAHTGDGEFTMRGGPHDGRHLLVRERTRVHPSDRGPGHAHPDAPKDDDWRPVAQGSADVQDLEAGTKIEVLTDAPAALSHHYGEDAAERLEHYWAAEALVRVLERRNRMPLLRHRDWCSLRTVRPHLPAPSPRVRLWPCGQWLEDDAVARAWRVSDLTLARERSDPPNSLRLGLLRHALRHAGAKASHTMSLTWDEPQLEGYEWYDTLETVIGIKALPGPALRRARDEGGTHLAKRITVQATARHTGDVRRVEAPLWVLSDEDEGALVRIEDDPTSADELTDVLSRYDRRSHHKREFLQERAIRLLGSRPSQSVRRDLEARFEREIAERLGGAMAVEVRIRPDEPKKGST